MDKAARFYQLDHVVQVEIQMDQWDAFRNQLPIGGHCNFDFIGSNYDWTHANSIKVDGVVFEDAGIKKRSFCNSQSETKPALSIAFDKFHDELKKKAVDSLGIESMTLSNSIQDPTYSRQCLAYKLFADAGIKSPRCNLVHIVANGQDLGVYVNIEPLKKTFFKRAFGEPLGNLYEFAGERFEETYLPRFAGHLDAFGKDESLTDIKAIIAAIKTDESPDLDTLSKLVDIDQVIRYWAMEIVLIHWDAFARGSNNSYGYIAADGKMRIVPWGTDQIFTAWHLEGKEEERELYHAGNNLIDKLYHSPKHLDQLKKQVDGYLNTIFKEDEIITYTETVKQIVAPFAKDYQQWSLDRLHEFVRTRRATLNSFMGSVQAGQ